MKTFTQLLLLCLLLYSCGKQETVKKQTTTTKKKGILGYRFQIEGDFNGDGKREKLTERFVSTSKPKREAYKFYEGVEYSDMTMKIHELQTKCFLSSDEKLVKPLAIADIGLSFGLSYLKNEGDLDGDGADELSYVGFWPDYSSLNSCVIMTYKENAWQKYHEFNIWDWQLPKLPYMQQAFGIAGATGTTMVQTDSANQALEQQLLAFPGLIKKIANNQIQLIYRNEAERLDTAIVKVSAKVTQE